MSRRRIDIRLQKENRRCISPVLMSFLGCGAVRCDNARFCESCGHCFEAPTGEEPAAAADAPAAEEDVSETAE